MSSFKFASVALAMADKDPYASWFEEALNQAGVVHQVVNPSRFEGLRGVHVLLLCGNGSLDPHDITAVENFHKAGGAVVCCGSTWGLDELLGVSLTGEGRISRGTIVAPEQADRIWPFGAEWARFFGGIRVRETHSALVLQTESGDAAVTRANRAFFVAPHLGQTMALMLMGRSVENDAIGPDDGTCYLEDGVLRAEDGTNLLFDKDRVNTSDGAPFFGHPHVDTLREIWVRSILEAVEQTGTRALVFWQWPHNAPCTATFSVECEDFDPDRAQKLYERLAMYGMPAAWLVAVPGYPADVYRAIRKWDHETGLLIRSEDICHEEQVKIQNLTISRTSGRPFITSTRASNGRWNGLSKFYATAEASGARVSLSKGGRQPGTSGFLFGTCAPFYPVGSPVMEIGYSMYHPGKVFPRGAYEHIARQVIAHSGCLHVALDVRFPAYSGCASYLQDVLMLIRQARMLQIKPEDIYAYDKARRKLRIRYGTHSLYLIADSDVEGLTLLVSGEPIGGSIAGRRTSPNVTMRYGTRFTPFVFDLEQKAQSEVLFDVAAQLAS